MLKQLISIAETEMARGHCCNAWRAWHAACVTAACSGGEDDLYCELYDCMVATFYKSTDAQRATLVPFAGHA